MIKLSQEVNEIGTAYSLACDWLNIRSVLFLQCSHPLIVDWSGAQMC